VSTNEAVNVTNVTENVTSITYELVTPTTNVTPLYVSPAIEFWE